MDNYTGRVLGNRYVLKEIIGVGGMAVVYKAVDSVDNKIVAVKILKEEYISNDDFRRRFRNESQAIAVLSHQNIVKVYDVGLGDKIQYIVMEYIEGITLKEYIRRKGALDWREAVIYTAQILKALRHAHEKGVIHRDIKPQNIMLLKENRTIKVADFGIASISTGRGETKTMADGAIGSVHYISPEQAKGEIVDNRADIYSVGVILYEMITGQLPFQSDSAVSVALMQLQKDPVMPRKIKPEIPKGIEQITMHAMQKRPDDRYQSASEMLLDLGELRKNPGKDFAYIYAATDEPTRYVPPVKKEKYASGKPVGDPDDESTYRKRTVITKEPEPYEEEVDYAAIERKSYTLPILMGIIFVMVVVVVCIAWRFLTKSEEVIVPDFVGKNIEEIRDDDEYKYFFDHGLIEENLKYNTDYKEGEIFNQSKPAGSKLLINNTASSIIKLDIAHTSKTMVVPEIPDNTKLQDARRTLQNLGFKIKTEGVVAANLPESTVIKTSPKAGESVPFNSTVTIYYAISDAGKVAVPNVKGEKLSQAKAELEDLGFKVVVEYKEAGAENSGLVIDQSIEADSTVIASQTEITIVVGTASKKSAMVAITLPDLSAYGKIVESVYVHVDGDLVQTISNVELNGSSKNISMQGTGAGKFAIYIGSQLVCSGNVDFTTSPPTISNKSVKAYDASGIQTTQPVTTTQAPVIETTTQEPMVNLPVYVGKQASVYLDQLIGLGFSNVKTIDIDSDKPEGTVIKVTSDKISYPRSEVKNADITVYISKGPQS